MPIADGRVDEFNAVHTHLKSLSYDPFTTKTTKVTKDSKILIINFGLFVPFVVLFLLEFQAKELLGVIQHDLLAHFRFHINLLKLFQPALDADGRPVGTEHGFVLE